MKDTYKEIRGGRMVPFDDKMLSIVYQLLEDTTGH